MIVTISGLRTCMNSKSLRFQALNAVAFSLMVSLVVTSRASEKERKMKSSSPLVSSGDKTVRVLHCSPVCSDVPQVDLLTEPHSISNSPSRPSWQIFGAFFIGSDVLSILRIQMRAKSSRESRVRSRMHFNFSGSFAGGKSRILRSQ